MASKKDIPKDEQIEISAIINLSDYEHKISLQDYVGTLQIKEREKDMIKRLYQNHKDLKTVKNWKNLIET